MNTKKYVAILDQPDPKNSEKFWMSGQIRTLNDKQAEPLLDRKKITEYIKPEPKRKVMLINPDGTKEEMSWGEYLKRKRRRQEN
ncbi:hypothetical protein KKC67_03460 [Patescibacteria group bacterium]|nr:hypothetical protein [Patescibacteria group bacterium]MBU1992037.1 hypothetical protein [Patescibacteria group bacterium]MBU2101745.1 hypothetical protein [Patescibacteria group bacterium]MBU2251794.1 hypothetical protein [Candidatus Omnitrophota bacterium]